MLAPEDALRTFTPLTFVLAGLSKAQDVYAPMGTGFFIAPYLGVTAKHVGQGLWDELEMPWKRGKYPTQTVEPAFYVAASQMVDVARKDLVANWEVTGLTPLNLTDIEFLNLVPRNKVAAEMKWPAQFPRIELVPPPVGVEVWCFGYPGATHDHRPGESTVNLMTEPTLIGGEVLAHFDQGRGSWRFPQFQVSMPFEPGMSGGPVMHDGNICGVISYGPQFEEGPGASYAACLWPVLLSEVAASIDPRNQNNPVLDLLRTGFLRSPGWKDLFDRVRIGQTETGYDIATLTPK